MASDVVKLVSRSSGDVELVFVDCYVPEDLPTKVDLSFPYYYLRIGGLIVQNFICRPEHCISDKRGMMLVGVWDCRELTTAGVVAAIDSGNVGLMLVDFERDLYGVVCRSVGGPIRPGAIDERSVRYDKPISGVSVQYEVDLVNISLMPLRRSPVEFLSTSK
jgi:hypothetical protein